MTSQSKVLKDVRSAIASRGRFGGRNPVSDICAQTGYNTVVGKAQVEAAVHQLKRDKEIVVDQEHGRISSIQKRATPLPPRMDRADMSPQAKREQTFAKGVPSFLTDDMVTPVVITHSHPRVDFGSKTGPASPPTSVSAPIEAPVDEPTPPAHVDQTFVEGDPYHESLTKCLMALREMADPMGYGQDLSVRKVLLLMGNMTEGRVTRAMDHLQGMGLYSSTKTGFQKSSYTVDLTVERVTAEMVSGFRSGNIVPVTSPQAKPGSEPEAASEPVAAQAAEPETVTETPDAAAPAASEESENVKLSHLLDLFEAQERELTRLRPEVDGLKSENAELRERFETVSAETEERLRAEFAETNAALQTDLAARTSQVDDLTETLADVNAQRDRLIGELAESKRTAASLNFEIEGLKSEIEGLRRKSQPSSPLAVRLDAALARHK